MLCIHGTSHGPLCPPYVRVSQVAVLLKRLNVAKQHHTIAQGLLFSGARDFREIREIRPG